MAAGLSDDVSRITRRNKRVSKDNSSWVGTARSLMALAAMAAVAGCDETRPVGTIGHVKGFAGLVAADEPRAVLVARDVLSAGGTAADAAVALYFTLAVTYPSTASLGGGGVCVIHDRDKKRTEVLDFVAPPTAEAGQTPTSVPANPRGFYALQAKYGKLRWESLLAEPERLARLGTSVSRALASDIARATPLLARDPLARRTFFRPDGSPLREADQIQQIELAGVIGRLRNATGDFYVGNQARAVVEGAASVGARLALDELRDFKPQWRDTIRVPLGNEIAHFAPPPAVASTVAAQLVAGLADRWPGTAEDERPHLLAEASARAMTARAGWMAPTGATQENPANLISAGKLAALTAGYAADKHVPTEPAAGAPADAQAGTGFAIVDSYGSAVACGLTSYGLFGSGRMVPGAGFFLAGAPGRNGPPAVAPMLLANKATGAVFMAASATGGVTAPSALAWTVLQARETKTLDQALGLPRLHHNGTPDIAFVEAGTRALDPEPLVKRGHKVTQVKDMPSRVNAVSCREGRTEFPGCQAATDPRGFGLADLVGKK
jgi:gamma-glutamyltranspeptidase/glutathione hydrolase